MKVLMIGDLVGNPGREALHVYLPELKNYYEPDLIIANGENVAPNGRGITRAIARELFELGVDCITLGNHAWGQVEIFDFIDEESRIIRPANYPQGTPGRGFATFSVPHGKCTVINLLGRTFMATLDCPFRTAQRIIQEIPEDHFIIVDIHAETTSEKQSLAWFLDGKVSAVIGTHTHVQTADERILPKGTGYLTDVGMTGAYNSILGMKKESILRKFLTQLPVRFEVAKGSLQLNAVLIELKLETKKTKNLQRIRIDEMHPWMV
jgi:2',3'-cyclic-nucleotide 2'-phosphodiesterase